MLPRIFDCTTFYNSNLLFQTRYNILKDYVDFFVVCEASKDHVGNKKNYNFDKNFFYQNKNKIIYIQVDDLPSIIISGKKDYKLLKIQMENLFKGLNNANDNDLIIFSDEDEIPNPNAISKFNYNNYKFGIFLQNMYYYKINVQNLDEGKGNWPGSRICKKKFLKSFFKLRTLKIKNLDYPFWRLDKEKSIQLIDSGGWHFTYLMKPEQISNKIKSMAHTEFNKSSFSDIEEIKKRIENLIDPFNRNFNLKKVVVDDSYPEYIRKNINLFDEWILK